ncbi:MAG: YlzJ-like family protein [Bacillota bacterium]|jgi:hypothetical protein
MLWSIVPEEIIFEGFDKIASAGNNYRMINYLGKQVLAMPMPDGGAKIVSLISSDPMDFIDSRFAPGNTISSPWI